MRFFLQKPDMQIMQDIYKQKKNDRKKQKTEKNAKKARNIEWLNKK